jgi:putative spermidine/putrescine transport system ATP-binding protein
VTRAIETVAASIQSMETQAKSLTLRNVSKRFGSVTALYPTSLEVKPGELVALLGPSGCGKTTTLRLIAGFEFSDSGQVLIGGTDVSNLPPNKRGLGMVFQHYSLFPHMSVAENIAFGLRMAGVSKVERDRAVARMLELIRLPEYGSRHVSQLSGGQQQRVALARAIVTNPSVLLLDEPLGALDKNLREGMQFEIRRLQQRLGITSVMVTHDQEEAMTMSDRIAVMSHGRILQSGPPREVYERPRNRFVAEFLGTANILGCAIVRRCDGGVLLRFGNAAQEVAFASRTAPEALAPTATECEVALRPEKILLNSGASHHVHLRGAVKEHVFRGSQHVYLIDLPSLGTSVYACQQAAPGFAGHGRGEPVQVSFDPSDLVVLESADGFA